MKIKFWHHANKYDSRNRWKLVTIAWGKGLRPLGNSKKYYRHFLTIAVTPRLMGLSKRYKEFRAYALGVEFHYRA